MKYTTKPLVHSSDHVHSEQPIKHLHKDRWYAVYTHRLKPPCLGSLFSLTTMKLELAHTRTLDPTHGYSTRKILYWSVFTSCSRPTNHVLFHPLFFVISGWVISRKWRGVSVWPCITYTGFIILFHSWVESQPFCNCNFAKCRCARALKNFICCLSANSAVTYSLVEL